MYTIHVNDFNNSTGSTKSVSHIYHESNKCADDLSRRGCAQQEDFVILEEPPSVDLSNFLSFDASGLCSYRLSAAMPSILAS